MEIIIDINLLKRKDSEYYNPLYKFLEQHHDYHVVDLENCREESIPKGTIFLLDTKTQPNLLNGITICVTHLKEELLLHKDRFDYILCNYLPDEVDIIDFGLARKLIYFPSFFSENLSTNIGKTLLINGDEVDVFKEPLEILKVQEKLDADWFIEKSIDFENLIKKIFGYDKFICIGVSKKTLISVTDYCISTGKKALIINNSFNVMREYITSNLSNIVFRQIRSMSLRSLTKSIIEFTSFKSNSGEDKSLEYYTRIVSNLTSIKKEDSKEFANSNLSLNISYSLAKDQTINDLFDSNNKADFTDNIYANPLTINLLLNSFGQNTSLFNFIYKRLSHLKGVLSLCVWNKVENLYKGKLFYKESENSNPLKASEHYCNILAHEIDLNNEVFWTLNLHLFLKSLNAEMEAHEYENKLSQQNKLTINFIRLFNFKTDLLYPLEDSKLSDSSDCLFYYGLLLLSVYHKQEILIESCVQIMRNKFIAALRSNQTNDVTLNKYIITHILVHLTCPDKDFKDVTKYIKSDLNNINEKKLDSVKAFFDESVSIRSDLKSLIANLLSDIYAN